MNRLLVLLMVLLVNMVANAQTEKVQQDEFQGLYISPRMQVKRFYEYCFWPNYIRGKRPAQENSLNLYEILKRIVKCIGSDFQYDLETMRI